MTELFNFIIDKILDMNFMREVNFVVDIFLILIYLFKIIVADAGHRSLSQ